MCFLKCKRTDSNILFFSIIGSDQNRIPLAMIQTMKKLKSGYINGTRVMLGNLNDFLNTSAITDLSFLGSQEDGYPDSKLPFLKLKFDFRFKIFIAIPHRTEPQRSSLPWRASAQIYKSEKHFDYEARKSTKELAKTNVR